MMKEKLERSEIEVIRFEETDVIATSGSGTFTGTNDTIWNDDEEEVVLVP